MSRVTDWLSQHSDSADRIAQQRIATEESAANAELTVALLACWAELIDEARTTVNVLENCDDEHKKWPTGKYKDTFVEAKYGDDPWRHLDNMVVTVNGEKKLAYRLLSSYERNQTEASSIQNPFLLLETGELARLTEMKDKKGKVTGIEVVILRAGSHDSFTRSREGDTRLVFDPKNNGKKITHHQLIKYLKNLQYCAKRWRIDGRRA